MMAGDPAGLVNKRGRTLGAATRFGKGYPSPLEVAMDKAERRRESRLREQQQQRKKQQQIKDSLGEIQRLGMEGVRQRDVPDLSRMKSGIRDYASELYKEGIDPFDPRNEEAYREINRRTQSFKNAVQKSKGLADTLDWSNKRYQTMPDKYDDQSVERIQKVSQMPLSEAVQFDEPLLVPQEEQYSPIEGIQEFAKTFDAPWRQDERDGRKITSFDEEEARKNRNVFLQTPEGKRMIQHYGSQEEADKVLEAKQRSDVAEKNIGAPNRGGSTQKEREQSRVREFIEGMTDVSDMEKANINLSVLEDRDTNLGRIVDAKFIKGEELFQKSEAFIPSETEKWSEKTVEPDKNYIRIDYATENEAGGEEVKSIFLDPNNERTKNYLGGLYNDATRGTNFSPLDESGQQEEEPDEDPLNIFE